MVTHGGDAALRPRQVQEVEPGRPWPSWPLRWRGGTPCWPHLTDQPDRPTRLAARPCSTSDRPVPEWSRGLRRLTRHACSTPVQCAGVWAFTLHGRGFRVVVAAAFAKRSWLRRGVVRPSVPAARPSARRGKRRDPCGGLPSCRRVSCVTTLIADVTCSVGTHTVHTEHRHLWHTHTHTHILQ